MSDGDGGGGDQRSGRLGAVRLTFEYERGDVRLVAADRRDMVAPAPERLVHRQGEHGTWVEVRDDEGRAIYRRHIGDPMPTDVEVPAEDGERLTRVPVEPAGRFWVLVPDLGTARTVALTATVDREGRPSGVLRDLAWFELGPGARGGRGGDR